MLLIVLAIAAIAVWGSVAWLLVGSNSDVSKEPLAAVAATTGAANTKPASPAGATAATTPLAPGSTSTAVAPISPTVAPPTATAVASPSAAPATATPVPATPVPATPVPATPAAPASLRAANATQLRPDPRGGISVPGAALATLVRFAPTGTHFAAADSGAHVLVGDLSQGTNTTTLSTTDGDDATALRFSPNGGTLAWGTAGGTVEVCSASACAPRQRTLIRLQFYITAIAFSPDGQTIAIGAGNTAHVCKLATQACDRIEAFAPVNAVEFDAAGRTLAVADANVIDLFSMPSGSKLAGPPSAASEAIDVVFAGDEIISGWNNGEILQWNRTTGNLVRISGPRTASVQGVNQITHYPGADVVVTADGPGSPGLGDPGVNIWSRSATGFLRNLTLGKTPSVSITADGRTLAAVVGGRINLWSMP